MLLEHFAKYNKLDENVIERVFLSRSKDDYETSENSNEVLVHGVNGRKIKPQTANQRKLVQLMQKNDMLFDQVFHSHAQASIYSIHHLFH